MTLYEFGQRVSGKFEKILDQRFVLDDSVLIIKCAIEGAEEVASIGASELTVREGERFVATVSYPIFRKNGGLFPYGGRGDALLCLSNMQREKEMERPKPVQVARSSLWQLVRRVL